jgi:hypothetical protein
MQNRKSREFRWVFETSEYFTKLHDTSGDFGGVSDPSRFMKSAFSS